MAIKSFKRYEKKYLLTKEQHNLLIPRLLEYMDFDKHCQNNKNYNIYSIYYDDDNNDVIRHSISAPYYKEKLRLRSYKASISKEDIVFLELKKKINKIVNKRRIVVTLEEALNFLENKIRPHATDYINNQILNEIEYYLENHSVHPAVYIGYSRKAFFAKDNPDFRLTIDSQILTRRNELSLESPCFGEDILEENQYLMEVKILGSIPLWFANILSDLKIYNTHFSKYGTEFENYLIKKQFNTNKGSEITC